MKNCQAKAAMTTFLKMMKFKITKNMNTASQSRKKCRFLHWRTELPANKTTCKKLILNLQDCPLSKEAIALNKCIQGIIELFYPLSTINS